MAQDFLNTGTQGGNFDGLKNFMARVQFKKTSFLSACGTTDAIATLHKWSAEDIKDAADTTAAEGFDSSFASTDITARETLSNECSLLKRDFKVSATQDAVQKAGLGKSSEFENARMNKYKELAKDLDRALLISTAVTRVADSGTAGKMTGAVNALSTYTLNNGGNLIVDNVISDFLHEITDGGADPDTIFVNGANKNAISAFATNNRQYVDGNKTYTNDVLMLDLGWGMQKIVYNKHLTATTILIVEMQHMKVAYLRPLGYEELGKTGDHRRGFCFTEATLQYGSRKAGGVITNTGAA